MSRTSKQITSQRIALIVAGYLALSVVCVFAIVLILKWFSETPYQLLVIVPALMALTGPYYAIELLAVNPQTKIGKIADGVFIGSLVVLALAGAFLVPWGLWIVGGKLYARSPAIFYVLLAVAVFAGCFWGARYNKEEP